MLQETFDIVERLANGLPKVQVTWVLPRHIETWCAYNLNGEYKIRSVLIEDEDEAEQAAMVGDTPADFFIDFESKRDAMFFKLWWFRDV